MRWNIGHVTAHPNTLAKERGLGTATSTVQVPTHVASKFVAKLKNRMVPVNVIYIHKRIYNILKFGLKLCVLEVLFSFLRVL
jgi:hypothetical protein